MDLHTLHDRMEITDALHRYARAVDTRDWQLWRSVFTEDAHLDYRSAGGIAGTRDDVAKWLEEVLAALPVTQHYITNIEVELTGDTATVTAMFYNPMRFPGTQDMSECGGWYHHDFVRTAQGWKSRKLVEQNLWFKNPPAGLST
jgi:3-phenylpropionate/cinnamic acid dioxygenase small subunit